jgi:hypothetical protein
MLNVESIHNLIIHETIFNVIECDITFVTYDSEILNDLIQELNPVYVSKDGCCQNSNAYHAIRWNA